MGQLGPFMGGFGGGMGGGGGGAVGGAGGEAAEEEVKEEVKEKTHYDVELTAFDAATKVKLIKEVRGALGLGLKEAKDTVEGVPVWLKKELIKEEAEELKEKLEKVGGTIKLV
jgi:large subunit ribosomal protein L7/L12